MHTAILEPVLPSCNVLKLVMMEVRGNARDGPQHRPLRSLAPPPTTTAESLTLALSLTPSLTTLSSRTRNS